mmetsp:Transcript_91779/g.201209  ORF Transcript_91779/g.201209 Transcript_91779/m.201209 type:complete len:381 (+) Transcript_91779:70-1212(+)
MPRYAAVEGGGTTFVVCIAEESISQPTTIIERTEFPTRTPAETIPEVAKWLAERDYDSLGVAMFGPIDMDPASPTWGWVTTTPKPGWGNTDVMGPLLKVRNVPCMFDTDVNAPALEEFRHFARPGESSCAYVTIGTGIGVGLVVNGRCVRGLVHPEGGHIPTLKRLPDDNFKGVDIWHPWSVEGQCSAPALASRAGVSQNALKDLPDDHEVWDDAAYMLGALCATLCALLSVERIVLGGGVMLRESLFPKVRKSMRTILNGYIQHPRVTEDGPSGIDGYIVPSVRGNDAGLWGALALASDSWKQAAPLPTKSLLAASSASTAAPAAESSEDSAVEEVLKLPRKRNNVVSVGYSGAHIGAAFAVGVCATALVSSVLARRVR